MHPLGSLEEVQNVLRFMMDRSEPLIRQLAPVPGTRAARYAQLLCPDLHPLDEPAAPAEGAGEGTLGAPPGLAGRLDRLEAQVARLEAIVRRLAEALGETDVLSDPPPAADDTPDPPEDLAP